LPKLVQRLDLRNTEHAHGIAEQGLAFQGAREQRSREPLARSSRLSQVEIAATSSFDGAQASASTCFSVGLDVPSSHSPSFVKRVARHEAWPADITARVDAEASIRAPGKKLVQQAVGQGRKWRDCEYAPSKFHSTQPPPNRHLANDLLARNPSRYPCRSQ
jgi:hypothetical protein